MGDGDPREAGRVHVIDPSPDRMLTRRELADHWRISLWTLNQLVREGLPSETWGRRMRRFSLAEAEAWRRTRRAA